ncbi:MAG: Hsp70 family protein [Ginsengibacter sp.]
MDICLGIDLGTTFSCVAFIDEHGTPNTIPATEGSETTPSVIWFDGKVAFVGKKANDRKIMPTSPVYEFVKRDMGRLKAINTRYEVNGFYYGAAGFSAIILRKLKKEAFNFLKKKGLIAADADEKSTVIPAVITVPAYFGDLQRHDTKNAGYAAGLHVVSMINEPTAAALAYGRTVRQNKKILVFDLGGGTFDVTILKFIDGESIVIASDGADQLGGKDWDEVIMHYLYTEFKKRTGKNIPQDMGWEIQQKATDAKLDLTDNEQTIVTISSEETDIEIILYRSDQNTSLEYGDFDMDVDRPFYFEERSSNLLSLCRTICTKVIEQAGMRWGDIDEIILAGGSCRMPMVHKLLEDMAGRKINASIPGFSYDTAIAIGAAIYGSGKNAIQDVTSKTIGIELKSNGRPYIEHLIGKNKLLPAQIVETFKAENNAVLKIYEGESHRPDECILRGKLQLGNPEGDVKVTMLIDENGVLNSLVEFGGNHRELQIVNEDEDIDQKELKNKVHNIEIRL